MGQKQGRAWKDRSYQAAAGLPTWYATRLREVGQVEVCPADVQALVTPVDFPNELELLQVIEGDGDRIACVACRGTGTASVDDDSAPPADLGPSARALPPPSTPRLPPQKIRLARESLDDPFGFTMRCNDRGDILVVAAQAPAVSAGLCVGDVLTHLDGRDLFLLDRRDVTKRIRNLLSVELTVERTKLSVLHALAEKGDSPGAQAVLAAFESKRLRRGAAASHTSRVVHPRPRRASHAQAGGAARTRSGAGGRLEKRSTAAAAWLHENGEGGWEVFAPAMASVLESAWREGAGVQLNVAGPVFEYQFDLTTMVQTNLTTGRARAILRLQDEKTQLQVATQTLLADAAQLLESLPEDGLGYLRLASALADRFGEENLNRCRGKVKRMCRERAMARHAAATAAAAGHDSALHSPSTPGVVGADAAATDAVVRTPPVGVRWYWQAADEAEAARGGTELAPDNYVPYPPLDQATLEARHTEWRAGSGPPSVRVTTCARPSLPEATAAGGSAGNSLLGPPCLIPTDPGAVYTVDFEQWLHTNLDTGTVRSVQRCECRSEGGADSDDDEFFDAHTGATPTAAPFPFPTPFDTGGSDDALAAQAPSSADATPSQPLPAPTVAPTAHPEVAVWLYRDRDGEWVPFDDATAAAAEAEWIHREHGGLIQVLSTRGKRRHVVDLDRMLIRRVGETTVLASIRRNLIRPHPPGAALDAPPQQSGELARPMTRPAPPAMDEGWELLDSPEPGALPAAAAAPEWKPPPAWLRRRLGMPRAPRTSSRRHRLAATTAPRAGLAAGETGKADGAGTQPLPPGWERRTTRYGRPFFIDHTAKRTQWAHPCGSLDHAPGPGGGGGGGGGDGGGGEGCDEANGDGDPWIFVLDHDLPEQADGEFSRTDRPPCWVCRGTGKTSKWLAPAAVGSALAGTAEAGAGYDCCVCYDEGQFGVSVSCGRHFYCTDCIVATLNAALEAGQFPAICPMCRAETPNAAATPDGTPPQGHIDAVSLSFLQRRGVISRDFLFRFDRAARIAAGRPGDAGVDFGCPAKCGRFLLPAHPSYRGREPGRFFVEGEAEGVRLGECPCGARVCVLCHTVQEGGPHACKEAHGSHGPPTDKATLQLIAKIAKRCPGCGNPIQKNAGCHVMMCGTVAHGKIRDAIRNGGCGYIFHWDTLNEIKSDSHIGLDGKRSTQPPITDRQILLPRTIEWQKKGKFPPNMIFCDKI